MDERRQYHRKVARTNERTTIRRGGLRWHIDGGYQHTYRQSCTLAGHAQHNRSFT
jgi:hypothetical protein